MISIIIPCYNQGEFISDCIKSVKNQSYTDWECIVINDGSTDYSKIVIEEEIANDNRFVLINQENKGLSTARNIGIALATGKYILPLDADDRIDKNFISKSFRTSILYCLGLVARRRRENFGCYCSLSHFPLHFSLKI